VSFVWVLYLSITNSNFPYKRTLYIVSFVWDVWQVNSIVSFI
jgi:hypothetical protein